MPPEPHAVAADNCEHHYATQLLGGHPLSVRACTLCHTPDWDDLMEQALALYQWGHQEGLAGHPRRKTLSAYDKPREAPQSPCTGFPDDCPNLRAVEPGLPRHEGGIRCGCGDDTTAPRAAGLEVGIHSEETTR
jgi:hypothetical protein